MEMTFPMSRGLLLGACDAVGILVLLQVEMTFPMSRGLLRELRSFSLGLATKCGNDLPDE